MVRAKFATAVPFPPGLIALWRGETDASDLIGLHLQLLTRTVVELVREETMRAPHVAHAGHENVEEHGRDRLSDQDARVPFKDLFCCKIH